MTKPKFWSFNLIIIALLVLTGAVLPSSAEEWPTKPITIVAAAKPGGSLDRLGRAIAGPLSERLGVPVNVVNKSGASTMLGNIYMLQQPQDGHTLLIGQSAYWPANITTQNAPYKLEDLHVINIQWPDYSSILLNKERPYKTYQEILEVIRNEPKKLSVAVIANSTEHINLLLTLESLKIPVENLRIVTYESGAKVRTAVAGGQVDFACITFEGSVGIYEFVRKIAVYNDEPLSDYPDMPIINEALKPYGVKLPIIPSALRNLVVGAKFVKDYPERYDKLLKNYKAILEDPEVKKKLDKQKIRHFWFGPEKSQKITMEQFESLVKYQTLLEKYR